MDDHIGYSWIGAIDEVSFYNRALSAEEIRAIYQRQK
ncbi:MAG: LamG domain-containing protein [Acidobacteriota bacterium]|nr:LamG domain-containing protein [Acidobacteriota bacterium]